MLVKYNDPERQRNNLGQVALIGVAITLRLPEDPKGVPERAAETPGFPGLFGYTQFQHSSPPLPAQCYVVLKTQTSCFLTLGWKGKVPSLGAQLQDSGAPDAQCSLH